MATTVNIPFTSPIGRLVQGDAYTASDKDQQGNLRVVKTGPRAGQPNPQYFIAVAFPKWVNGQPNPEWQIFEQALKTFGAGQWPALFPQGPYGQQPRNFSWKISDGDGIDNNNKQNKDKPGFAGCWVVSFTSSFAPQLWRMSAPGQYVAVGPGEIKRGHYVQVSGNISSNENPQNPGVYINLQQVLHVAIGEEIITGPTAQQAFGTGPAALPPGAQALPVGAPMPGGPAMLPGAPPPQQAYAHTPAPAPAGPVHLMTAKANGVPYESFIAQGWKDHDLVAQGYMDGVPA